MTLETIFFHRQGKPFLTMFCTSPAGENPLQPCFAIFARADLQSVCSTVHPNTHGLQIRASKKTHATMSVNRECSMLFSVKNII